MKTKKILETRPVRVLKRQCVLVGKVSRMAIIVAALMLAPGRSTAVADEPYSDRDASYLKIADTFLYPVGAVLEYVIFRPLHSLQLRGVRGVRTGFTTHEGTMRVQRGCASARPPRYCTDVRYQN